jgi:pyruvate ferredoxin oxidoreductase alpha subunit
MTEALAVDEIEFLADGYVDGDFIMVESEHAAMSACVGAAASGGRVATATSSQGFALMIEVLYQASGMRLPIVLTVVNRALAKAALFVVSPMPMPLVGTS